MRQEILRHGEILLVYLVAVTLMKWQWQIDLLWLWMGGGLGFALIFLDRWVYALWLAPQEQLSQQVQYVMQKRDIKKAMELMYERRGEQKKLVFRSILFILAWVPLAIFSLTSTGSLFAEGLVMGLGLHLLIDFWRDQLADPMGLNQRLFWQIKRVVDQEEQKVILYLFTGVFVIMTWWLV